MNELGELPKALRLSAKQFGMVRRRQRLNLTSGSTTVNAGDVLRIALPTNSIVDLSTLVIHANLTNITATTFAPPTTEMIRRFGAQVGPINLNYANNNYGHCSHMLNVASVGEQYDKGASSAGFNLTDRPANNSRISFNWFPNSICSAGILDTAVFGSTELDLQLNGQECMYYTDITAATPFILTEIVAYVDVLETQGRAYGEFMASEKSNRTLKKIITLATAVEQVAQGTNQFNIGTGCLDRVMVMPKASTFKTIANVSTGDPYSLFSRSVDLSSNTDAYIYASINGVVFPTYGASDYYEENAEITRNAFAAGSQFNYNKLYLGNVNGSTYEYTSADYLKDNAVLVLPVGGMGPAAENNGVMTGIDLKAQNSQIQIESSNLPSNARLIMAGQHSSVLEASADKGVMLSL